MSDAIEPQRRCAVIVPAIVDKDHQLAGPAATGHHGSPKERGFIFVGHFQIKIRIAR
ncbi:hypothetical protein NKI04_29730 [Mesorhizobium sp. M0814]|uniref:hypothetical protein n=1 Tax=unclassified Mesorhizobium TaxID=325217 RepID=UPI00333D04B2